MIDIDKLTLIFKEIVDELAIMAEEDVRYTYISYVDHFYNDYDPLYYHRLGNIVTHNNGLYNALHIKRDTHVFNFVFDDSLLPPHNQPNSIVMELNMNRGIHGGIQFIKSRISPPITSPSIIESMREFWKTYSTTTITNSFSVLVDKNMNRILQALKEVS